MPPVEQATPIQQQSPSSAGVGNQAPAVVERLPRRETIVVESMIPVLDTAMFEHMQRIATTMASSNLVPEHLNKRIKVEGEWVELSAKEAIANCFLVVNQAIRWKMDPFAVAQHVYTTKGRVGYEGKLIAAIINTHPSIERRLTYKYDGTGKDRKVTVTAKLKGEDQPQSIEGRVKDWETTGTNSPWSNPNRYDQQLSYRGAREWARRWAPEIILGVWGDDEIEQFAATDGRIQAEQTHAHEPQRGAAGLKAALGASSSNVSDAEVIPPERSTPQEKQPAKESAEAPKTEPAKEETKPAAPKPEEKKGGKQPGTTELFDKYIARFKETKDDEMLGILGDETRMYEWTAQDRKALDEAYDARMKELVEKG